MINSINSPLYNFSIAFRKLLALEYLLPFLLANFSSFFHSSLLNVSSVSLITSFLINIPSLVGLNPIISPFYHIYAIIFLLFLLL